MQTRAYGRLPVEAMKVSPAKVAYHRKQLAKLLSRTGDQQFLEMLWAISALRSGRPKAAVQLLKFPPAALDQSYGSQFAVYPWELETLIIQVLLSSEDQAPTEGAAGFDCREFKSVADLARRLRALENVESGLYLQDGGLDVFGEMQRIAQRQFHWQYGYNNLPQLYRYSYIYAQGQCGQFFQDKHGLPITELNFVGFVLYSHFLAHPWAARTMTLLEYGLTEEVMKRALPLLLISIDKARQETKKLVEDASKKQKRAIPIAYLPSILRRFPLFSLTEQASQFIAPIPDVLLIRVTTGLYYDILQGGQLLLNEANERFEAYCAAIICGFMHRFTVKREYRYEPKKGAAFDTPDLLVRDGDKTVLVAECKATKLTYLAQFAEDPFEAETRTFAQIAKAVFQLWRFFSHVRQGFTKEAIDENTAAMVLTLEPFRIMDQGLRAKIIQAATELAIKEGGINAEDQRPVIFCPITDLEHALSLSNEDQFVRTLKLASEEKYQGWGLQDVGRQGKPDAPEDARKEFPFDLQEVLPWYERVQERQQAKPPKKVALI
jgi:hypothetical protein